MEAVHWWMPIKSTLLLFMFIGISAVAALQIQDHGDFVGFADIALLNWTELECGSESLPVICDQRPVELYGKTIWKPCVFGYICIEKHIYPQEFERCIRLGSASGSIKLGSAFIPVLCTHAYEYPSDFNCESYPKFACQRGKHYIYSCICRNNLRKVDMTTCANKTVCQNGLTAKTKAATTTGLKTASVVMSTLSTAQTSAKPQTQAQPRPGLSTSLKIIICLLLMLSSR